MVALLPRSDAPCQSDLGGIVWAPILMIAEKLGVPLWRVSEIARELKEEELIKVAKNLPYISSLKKPNATYYLDAEKVTALYDVLMNQVWSRNIELGGRSAGFGFEYGGKTWYSDGLPENIGGRFILEVVARGYEERITEQPEAYSSQVGHRGIKGVIVVALDSGSLDRIREKVIDKKINLVERFIASLRCKDEKLQFKNLLLVGKSLSYHINQTAS